jgi:ATP-binding cassette subfamily C (CFTR/MRP) protein 4
LYRYLLKQAAPFLHYLVIGPVEVVVVLLLLWFQIGIAAVAGMGLLICLAPMEIKMGTMLMGLRSVYYLLNAPS